MSPVGAPREEKARMRLMLQAWAFHAKGRAVTAVERHALAEAVKATAYRPLPPAHQILREAALACLASDPLTDDCMKRLHGALGVFRTDKVPSRPTPQIQTDPDDRSYAWQTRRDLA